MELTSFLNQIHVEDSADQLVSVMKSGHNLLVTDDDYMPFVYMIFGFVIVDAIVLAIHWLLLPFTWLLLLAVVLYNCRDYYIENVLFFPNYLMLGK